VVFDKFRHNKAHPLRLSTTFSRPRPPPSGKPNPDVLAGTLYLWLKNPETSPTNSTPEGNSSISGTGGPTIISNR